MNEPLPFGRYELLGRLGQGGMAEVYLAVMSGPAGFQKLLVIKKLHEHLESNAEFLEMFLDEARLAARLNHPNVVQTHEVDAVDGRHFIAMEYLDGQDLGRIRRRCRERAPKCPIEFAVTVAARVLDGLHYAHELTDFDGTSLGIIHRDISPQNILVTYEGEVKVLDFGVAKAATQVGQTRAGVIKGKFSYISPERARGNDVDRRDDLWSVGVILWECLSGRRLFKAATDIGTLSSVLDSNIPSLEEIAPETPPQLIKVVERALSRNAKERYFTALEMRDDLEDYLATTTEFRDRRAIGELVKSMFADSYEKRRLALKAWLQEPRPVRTSRTSVTPISGPELPALQSGASAIEATPSDQALALGSASAPSLTPPSVNTPVSGMQETQATDKDRRLRGMLIMFSVILVGVLVAVIFLAYLVVAENGQREQRIVSAPTSEQTSPRHGIEPPEQESSGTSQPSAAETEDVSEAAETETSASEQSAPQNESSESAESPEAPREVASPAPSPSPPTRRSVRSHPVRQSASGGARPSPPPTSEPPSSEPPAATPSPQEEPLPATPSHDPEPSASVASSNSSSSSEESDFGYLSFDTIPWSRVSINGRSYGSTPLLRIRLPVGNHVLRAVNPDTGASAEYPVAITSNQTTVRRIGL